VKTLQQIVRQNQFWVALSSIGTLGGFIVTIVVLIWPGPPDKTKQRDPFDANVPNVFGQELPRGDTSFARLLEEGVDFILSNQLDRAFQSFDNAVRRIPADRPPAEDQALAYLYRGATDLLRGEHIYAITDLKDAFDRGGLQTKSLAGGTIGLAYLEIGDLHMADQWLHRAFELGSRQPEVLAGLGYLAYERHEDRLCVDYYTQALDSPLAVGQGVQRYLYGRALCANALGDYRNAMSDVEDALDMGGAMTGALLDFRADLLRSCGAACR
jgi:tetratricopeptide (TPR) repeat protein